jgi:competence protein ComEA
VLAAAIPRLCTLGLLIVAAALPLCGAALEINEATRAQIEQLDGAGVSMADRMLEERTRMPFAGWEDLRKRVKGLGPRRIAQWQSQGVTVNGERGENAREEQQK